MAAFYWNGKELKQRWVFDSNNLGWNQYAGQGNHNLRVGDVDGDGCAYQFHTFLEDSVYRISIATENVAYNQPTQPGFYVGPDLKKNNIPRFYIQVGMFR